MITNINNEKKPDTLEKQQPQKLRLEHLHKNTNDHKGKTKGTEIRCEFGRVSISKDAKRNKELQLHT